MTPTADLTLIEASILLAGKLETYGCDGFRLPMSRAENGRAPWLRQIALPDAFLDAGA